MPRPPSSPSQPAIFIVGPSSCGKTTLCNALAEDLQLKPELYIQEMARVVMATQGFTRDDIHTYEMQNAIMNAQLRAEQDAARHRDAKASVLFLSDRSAVDPVIYAATCGTKDAESMSDRLLHARELQENLPFYRKSLFVVVHAVPEWLVDDGIRSLKDPIHFNAFFCNTLEKLGIPFIEIQPNVREIQARVAFVRKHLSARQQRRSPTKLDTSRTLAAYHWTPTVEDEMSQFISITA